MSRKINKPMGKFILLAPNREKVDKAREIRGRSPAID